MNDYSKKELKIASLEKKIHSDQIRLRTMKSKLIKLKTKSKRDRITKLSKLDLTEEQLNAIEVYANKSRATASKQETSTTSTNEQH